MSKSIDLSELYKPQEGMMKDIKVFLSKFRYSPDKVFPQESRKPCNPIVFIEGNPYEGLYNGEELSTPTVVYKYEYLYPKKKRYNSYV